MYFQEGFARVAVPRLIKNFCCVGNYFLIRDSVICFYANNPMFKTLIKYCLLIKSAKSKYSSSLLEGDTRSFYLVLKVLLNKF